LAFVTIVTLSFYASLGTLVNLSRYFFKKNAPTLINITWALLVPVEVVLDVAAKDILTWI